MMEHILITGANGFIGSHLVRYLLELKKKENYKEEIVCLVRSTSDLSPLKGLSVKLFIGDLREPETLIQAVTGAKYIYHLGAELYTISRDRFMETNTEGTRNLLNAAKKYAKETLVRFLFASSQAAAGPSGNEQPVTEADEPATPVSWYAESKLEAEKIVKQFTSEIPITVVRPCSVYGERDPAFFQAFQAAKSGIRAVTGFRKSYTGMIYAPDLVEGMVAAAKNPKTAGETYYLANPENYTVKELAKTIGKAVGKSWGIMLPIPIFILRIAAIFMELLYLFTRQKPIPTRDKIRDLSHRFWLCTPQKALQDFGWQAKTSLIDGLKTTHRFYEEREKQLKRMPLEPKGILWLKYFFLALFIGAVIEALAAFGKVYFFQPWWLVFIIVLGLWGVIFGSCAMLTRLRGLLIQYIPGFVLLFGGELLNHYYLHKWEFSGGSLFGINDPVMRAAILGILTGFLIPGINLIMKQFYKRKLRLG